jgi:ubiquinone biosynthesis protein
MIFEHGFFHADPHPGNFFVEPDGVLGIIDFGMVGTVDEGTQAQLARLLIAITSQDADRLVDAFLEMGFSRRRVERTALRQDLEQLLSRYYGLPLGEIPLGPLISEAMAIVRRHRLQLPPNLVLLFKMTLMNEGMGARLDPNFNLTVVLAPYVQRLMVRQYSPAALARGLGRAGQEAAHLWVELPLQLRRILGEIERGGVEVGVRPEGFDPVLKRLERLANRLVLGMITAAFIVGTAVLMVLYHPRGWGGLMGPFFLFAFIMAATLGVYLAWTILRSGRR